jgi:hypothetical protein
LAVAETAAPCTGDPVVSMIRPWKLVVPARLGDPSTVSATRNVQIRNRDGIGKLSIWRVDLIEMLSQ